ncbi:ABC transporter substrate-binding protein [Sphingomonas immobilis]|uniref:ABC transporter substrate-binding protein n=1 Tax=Sphingomonas immobilis TaxID=3063997 RepID=A0ABT9A1V8_9SPHN|nr:ABC transporter substrate-binding protein [Sphingomonas sp. CA1-15]MDO7843790.1 ABC transporter substrate-binding protein [Sphingomonas sp. CA1-15]
MRGGLALAAVLCPALVAGCSAAAPPVSTRPAKPVRVMSMNQCTDQLVLALLPPERIASVTWLSRDPRYSAMVVEAARVAANRGSVEEVVTTRPDLIVTDTFSNPGGRALLARLGVPVVAIEDAMDVPAIRRNISDLATALGVPERGAALVAKMDARLVASPPVRGVRVAVWGRDGMREGPLVAAVIAAAGLTDVTPETGPTDTEALLQAAPDFLIEGDGADGGASLGDARRDTAIVRKRWPRSRILHISPRDTICGAPAIADAAIALRAQVRAAL